MINITDITHVDAVTNGVDDDDDADDNGCEYIPANTQNLHQMTASTPKHRHPRPECNVAKPTLWATRGAAHQLFAQRTPGSPEYILKSLQQEGCAGW